MIRMSESYVHSKWATGEKIKIRNKSYRIGKMSYGEYFAETGKLRSETEPFNNDTIWLKKIVLTNGIIEYRI